MKRIVAIIFLCAIFGGIVALFAKKQDVKEEYLRIHIRANSNLECDQDIKFQIKDKIVEFLTPVIASCQTRTQFESALVQNLPQIECIANKILAQNSFDYKSSAVVTREFFPTRSYQSVTLESGEYEALVVNLGSGKGDNWWCVVYPPLCFVNSSTTYKSRILEIIKNYFGG